MCYWGHIFGFKIPDIGLSSSIQKDVTNIRKTQCSPQKDCQVQCSPNDYNHRSSQKALRGTSTGGIKNHPHKCQWPKPAELPVLVAGTDLNFSKLLYGICVDAWSSSCLNFLPILAILAEEMVHSVLTGLFQRFLYTFLLLSHYLIGWGNQGLVRDALVYFKTL